MMDYFDRLRELVEDTYYINGGRRVILTAHSMGGMYGQYFLQLQTQEWKDRYVKAYVPINTPWKGSSLLAYIYASGYNWGLPIDRPLIMGIMRGFETATLLLPHPGTLEEGAWDANDVVIETAHRNYTTSNYEEFFNDVGDPEGYYVYQDVHSESYTYRHPGVDTYCAYSNGLDTPIRYKFEEGQFPHGYASIEYEDGDGTVDLRSLLACRHFLEIERGDHVAEVKEFPDMHHIDLLHDRRFLAYMKEIAFMED